MGGSPSLYVTTLPGLVAIGTVIVEIKTFLQIRLFYRKCGISVTVYTRLLAIIIFSKAHGMSTSFSVSNKISPILVKRFLDNEW